MFISLYRTVGGLLCIGVVKISQNKQRLWTTCQKCSVGDSIIVFIYSASQGILIWTFCFVRTFSGHHSSMVLTIRTLEFRLVYVCQVGLKWLLMICQGAAGEFMDHRCEPCYLYLSHDWQNSRFLIGQLAHNMKLCRELPLIHLSESYINLSESYINLQGFLY